MNNVIINEGVDSIEKRNDYLVDGDSVGDTISGVEDDSGGTAGGVEGEDGLDGDVHGGGVEGLEHDLERIDSELFIE